MLNTIGFFAKLAATLVSVNPKLKRLQKLKAENNNEQTQQEIFEFVRDWSEKRLEDTKCNITVSGVENIPQDKPVLFISNHQSNLDFILLLAKINVPVGFIAKVELEKIPLLRDWMRIIDCLFMDREDMRQQVKTIVEGINILKKGKSLIVFPEGTRTRDGNIMEFKAGTFKLATKSKVPIVPVTIDGTFKCLEGNNNHLRAGDIKLTIHEPVLTANLTKEEQNNLHNYIRDIVKKPLEENNE